jgi:hypothetical protein
LSLHYQMLSKSLDVAQIYADQLPYPPRQKTWNNLGGVELGLRFIISGNKNDPFIDHEYIAVLQKAILMSDACDFRPACWLACCNID